MGFVTNVCSGDWLITEVERGFSGAPISTPNPSPLQDPKPLNQLLIKFDLH